MEPAKLLWHAGSGVSQPLRKCPRRENPTICPLVRLIRLDKLAGMADKAMMTLGEAAAFLGVAKVPLRRWTMSGQLRCVRVGSRRDRRFRKPDLDAYIKRNMTPGKREIVSSRYYEIPADSIRQMVRNELRGSR